MYTYERSCVYFPSSSICHLYHSWNPWWRSLKLVIFWRQSRTCCWWLNSRITRSTGFSQQTQLLQNLLINRGKTSKEAHKCFNFSFHLKMVVGILVSFCDPAYFQGHLPFRVQADVLHVVPLLIRQFTPNQRRALKLHLMTTEDAGCRGYGWVHLWWSAREPHWRIMVNYWFELWIGTGDWLVSVMGAIL